MEAVGGFWRSRCQPFVASSSMSANTSTVAPSAALIATHWAWGSPSTVNPGVERTPSIIRRVASMVVAVRRR